MSPRDTRGTYLASRKFQLDAWCPGDVREMNTSKRDRENTNDHPIPRQKVSSLWKENVQEICWLSQRPL